MERIERAVIRECFRETLEAIGFRNQHDAAEQLAKRDDKVSLLEAEKYAKGQNIGGPSLTKLSKGALQILVENHEKVLHFYASRNDQEFFDFVEYLFTKYHSKIYRAKSIDIIAKNWKTPEKKWRHAFETGIYQIYRRYKPTAYEVSIGNARTIDPNEHAVICELLFADAETMECALITCQRNIYYGSLYVNRDGILFGVVQRPNRENTGHHLRFFCLKLEVKLPMYSAVMIKTGDTTGRPISSECIFVPVDRKEHRELCRVVERLAKNPWKTRRIDSASVVMDYISLSPDLPPQHGDWARVRYVKDFPALVLMAKPRGAARALFREPSRTLDSETIRGIATEAKIGVFRHTKYSAGEARNHVEQETSSPASARRRSPRQKRD